MKKVNRKDYYYLGRWVAPTLPMSLFFHWGEGSLFKEIGLVTKSSMISLDGHCYYGNNMVKDVRNFFKKRLEKKDFKFFHQFVSLADKQFNNFLELKEDIKKCNKTNRLQVLKEFIKRYTEINTPWVAVFFIELSLDKHFNDLCKRFNLDPDKFRLLATSGRKTFFEQEREELLLIQKELGGRDAKKLFKKDANFAKKLKEHLRRYRWIGTHHFWGTQKKMTDIFDDLKKNLESERDNRQKIVNSLPEELKTVMSIMGDLAWIRLQAAEVSDIMTTEALDMFKQFAKELGIKYEDLIWLSDQELVDHLENKTKPSIIELNQRKKAVGLFHGGAEKISIISGKKLEELTNLFMPSIKLKTDIIKGVVANKGMARGKVMVVLVPERAKLFKKGNILVAPETTPDYVFLMKKAAAIITDTGGITSHAAIVSRELGKPCIIGTKIATQVLKDGNLVEVDANKGVIKVIKNN